MPKCSNCKKPFEAYSTEPAKLPVIGRPALDVLKLTCPVCGAMQHLLPVSLSLNPVDNATPMAHI